MIIFGEGEPGDRDYIPLATQQGDIIKNVRGLEQSPEQLRIGIQHWHEDHPDYPQPNYGVYPPYLERNLDPWPSDGPPTP